MLDLLVITIYFNAESLHEGIVRRVRRRSNDLNLAGLAPVSDVRPRSVVETLPGVLHDSMISWQTNSSIAILMTWGLATDENLRRTFLISSAMPRSWKLTRSCSK